VRPRFELLVVTLLLAVVSGTALVSSAMAGNEGAPVVREADWREPPQPAAAPAPDRAPPAMDPAPRPAVRLDLTAEVSMEIEGFLAWAAIDRTTGEVVQHGEETSTTESMIKVWLAADYLRRQAEAGTAPDDEAIEHIRQAVRDSDDASAEFLYGDGGHNDVVERMIDMCGLTDTEIYPFWWSRTEMTALDAARLGECIVSGIAAGPVWTQWLLQEMRQVRGTAAGDDQRQEDGFQGGRWGIIDGLPPGIYEHEVAIKNGWTRIGRTDSWHVNCLAVTDGWVLAVMMRYPAGYSLDYGAERCASVAAQLFRAPLLAGDRVGA
jgi:hypothetical protein